jgi:DNA-binding transcriptional LysR family regulator
LTSGRAAAQKSATVRVRGNLTTNDGEIAVKWALEGHGILMRAEWDIVDYLERGALVPVLPEYRTPDADIFAVYSPLHQMSARVRVFIEFLTAELGE